MAEHTSPTGRGPRGSGTKSASAKTPHTPTPSHSPTPHSSTPQASTAKSAKPATAARKKPRPSPVVAAMIDPDRRRALIAQAAYFRAERRHFAPGHEAADWLAAESEVDTALTSGVAPSDN
jgi:hypothetical protein